MEIRNFIRDFRQIPSIIQKLQYLPWAIVDPNWMWFIHLMFANANIPKKYRYMFFPENEWEVFIDCWMNVWLITDIARKMNMEVYWFEPNPLSLKLFNKKYINDDKVHIYPCAVSDKEWEMDFYADPQLLFDEWWSIIEEFAKNNHVGGGKREKLIKTKVLRLTDIIKNDILPKHKHIHMLKIDIEWSEFWVVDDIINEWLYKNMTYIVVETHENFFKNWMEMLKNLKDKIKKNNIYNIYLDWI